MLVLFYQIVFFFIAPEPEGRAERGVAREWRDQAVTTRKKGVRRPAVYHLNTTEHNFIFLGLLCKSIFIMASKRKDVQNVMLCAPSTL